MTGRPTAGSLRPKARHRTDDDHASYCIAAEAKPRDPHGFSSSVKLPSGSTSSLAKSPAPLSTLDEVHVVNYSEEQMAGIFLKTNHAKQTQWSVLKTPPFFTQPNSDGTHSIQLEIEFRTTQFALNEIQVRVFRWVNNARRFQNAEWFPFGEVFVPEEGVECHSSSSSRDGASRVQLQCQLSIAPNRDFFYMHVRGGENIATYTYTIID
ncbi:hypothetical protein CAPTEDRAFT_191914 [Capitella teleta]|uniref:Uncharacterized protein n=1 Tax=Capitella teleta TaxID=283909 RepID=R7VKA0_CAPTE|nr:hypothetical protein CAPTEDRAFT_191914 [Capitella teleta]|eukprot:ELU16610.1 hypothetical protein CAPTEDRAFT_191914 [Capitella teleta]